MPLSRSSQLQCEFWNVGQGLFSSGRIQMGDAPVFHWVYDCGTSSSPKLLQNAVNEYNYYKNQGSIDLLVLSHFDKDHISDVKELLKNGREIKRWVVPYYPLWQRLVIALLLDIQPDDEEWAFYQNPIQYFKTDFAEELEKNQFLLLPAKENENEISISLDPSNFDDVLSFETTKKLSNEFDNLEQNVHWLNPNKALLFRKGEAQFEFVLYNVPFHLLAKVPTNLTAFQKQVESIIQSYPNDPSLALKKLYLREFGSSNANIISQHLYIRYCKNNNPVSYNLLNRFAIFEFPEKNVITAHSSIKAKSSILYTGDGSFNKYKLLSYFESAMGSERMQQIYCLQVMHHGSRDNWFKGVAAVLSPSLSVFSADETRKDCKHPHDEVVRDFLPYNPILVNKQKMLYLELI